MSAYLVDEGHIDAVLSYAVTKGFYFEGEAVTEHNATDFGIELLKENLDSVSYRYNESPGFVKDAGDDPENYLFQMDRRAFTPLEILKALTCIDYQSCEHPGWYSSRARALITSLAFDTTTSLPGWSDSPGWTIGAESPRYHAQRTAEVA